MEKSKRAAIVLAAGKGTRMKSGRAKVLHEANGKPLAWYPIQQALALKCDPVVVVVGHQGDEVRAQLEELFPDAPLRFAVQKEQLGTAHAVQAARRSVGTGASRILILYGDVPLLTTSTLRTLTRAGRRSPVAFLSMSPEDPTGYGRVVRDARGRVEAIVEHKDATAAQRAIGECNAGLYDCDATFLWKALRQVGASNAQGEYYLTDLVEAAAAAGTPAVAVEAPAEEVSGVNDRVELAAAARVLRRRICERWMRAGVTLIDPETVYLDEEVVLAPDVVVEPNVRIVGRSRIGTGTHVGFGSVIVDTVVGEDVTVRPYSVFEEARIGDRTTIGPFARLRPETVLGREVRVGNFVEIKKSTFGDGAKANHLAYVGDAKVGHRTNVGAGTITCNYDGTNKLATVLGDDVFIGSDTQLVAPVEVGDGAYVGAGSTVVRDVPAGALALSRAEQVIKEGWADRKRGVRGPSRKTAPAKKAANRRVRKG